MYTNTVRLPYTLWYDGHDKIFRMDMSTILPEEHYEDGKKYVGKIRNVQVGGYNVDGDIQPPPDGNHSYLEVTEFATAVYNEQKHYVDITLKSFPSFNADGEIALSIDYELAKGIEEYITDYSYQKKEVTIIIPIRSHENPSKDPGRFNNGIGIDKMDVRNGFAYTVGASEEPVVFSFELIERDITDEFITNGQALDMVKNKAIESANLVANDSGLGFSLNWKSFGQLSWDNLKQYLGGSNSTEYVATKLDDILSMLDNADLNNNNRLTSIVALGLQTNISVRENGSKDIDVNFTTTYYDSQGNNPTTRNYTLFTIPRSLLGGEGSTVDTESIKNSILSVIQQQIPNATTIKQEILADVNPRIPDKEVIKQEVLAAVPTSSYELTPGKMNAVINELDYATETTAFIDNIHNHFAYDQNLKFIKSENSYIIEYKNYVIMTIPFSSLRELPTATAGEPVTLEKILELVSDESKSEVISQLKSKLASTPLTAEQILDKATEAAADREKAGKLFQKLLDAETLNVVEQTDGYELSYSGDVNKVLVKIPKQAITVSQEVLTAAITENVVTETIKPTLDKSYYSKQEVDQLIQQLKHELMSEDHSEEHPQ